MVIEQHGFINIGREHLGNTGSRGANFAGRYTVGVGWIQRLRHDIQCTATRCQRYQAAGQRLVVHIAHRHRDRAVGDAVGRDHRGIHDDARIGGVDQRQAIQRNRCLREVEAERIQLAARCILQRLRAGQCRQRKTRHCDKEYLTDETAH